MNPCELTTTITALANTIAGQLSDDDLELAGVLFAQLADTLLTISVQRARCNKQKDTVQNDP